MKYKNKNPLEKLHPGEPYFFIRAQDLHSIPVIHMYAFLLRAAGDLKGCDEILGISGRFQDWQEANPEKVKEPD